MNNVLVIPQLKSFKNGEFSKYTRTVIQPGEEQDLDAMELRTYVDPDNARLCLKSIGLN
ncbi:hypothetical protein U6A24_09080 [Aquimarina gracilis]|uniref:Uncharacterized protein n=1 Tax=Aquimarina gracilis TaxID=874422 RepID=A0ABU5ZU51_9FLAO|nr:hypothetical protein [Aquimarina gracilis]MEB3345611.1 hypothetical protein [Aquimarina gracilis]